jgi:SAM-dependent methyltransferase
MVSEGEESARASGPDSYFDPAEFATRVELEARHYWHLHRRRLVAATLDRWLVSREGPLIEIGCGIGTVTTYLNELGYRVDYSDVHREALALAQARAEQRLGRRARDLQYQRLDVCQEDPPKGYAGLLMLDVLEHLPDDVTVIRRAKRALEATSGLLVLTVPAFQALWSPWDTVEKHKRRYTTEAVRRLVEGSGFRLLRLTYFFFPLFFGALATKSLRLLLGTVRKQRSDARFSDLAEARSGPALRAGIEPLLSIELAWLRKRDLPLGTSVLCVARA